MKPVPPLAKIQKRKVLIISDEPFTANVWGFSLNQVGLEVRLIGLSEAVLETWAEEIPDLIIIEDFNDQDEELEVCRQLRAVTVVPILYLTSKTNEKFHLEVYEAGADECVPFPITPRLFQAKVNAWLKRMAGLPLIALDEIRAGEFSLAPGQKQVVLPSGETVALTTLETRLLFLLMSHPGKVFRPEEIIRKVWGYDGQNERRLLKNHIYRLRRKIEPDPNHPRHLVNVGYTGVKFSG